MYSIKLSHYQYYNLKLIHFQFQQIPMSGNIVQDEVFTMVFGVRENVALHCVIYAVAV